MQHKTDRWKIIRNALIKMHVHEQRCLCIDVGSWTEFFHAELEDGESWPNDFPESLLPKKSDV